MYKIDGKVFASYKEAEEYAAKNGLCTCSIVKVQV